MLEIASQIILCLLLAALLGFIIGYLFGKGTCASENCENEKKNHDTEGHERKLDAHTSTEKITSAQDSVKEINALVKTEEDSNIQTDSKGEEDNIPELLKEARNGKKDNLTKIKGIGLKIDETLNNIGIYHFDQIALWNEKNIAWVDENIAFPGRVKRENWVDQAKALAEGIETEFSKRVDAGEVSSSKKS